MANERLNIPEELRVGYQKRKDTYSGKLAYVTYLNNKGEIAKSGSWNSWRDKEIKVGEFKNEPLEGFVLNRRVGGYKSGWNFRQTKCRVYDPRGFEVEISIENLLYILQECTSTKGKGIEGEFVYAWDGKELVLLPICSEDYKSSIEMKNKQEKIKTKDLKIGALYHGKEHEQLIYIGKFDWYSWKFTEENNGDGYYRSKTYYHKIINIKLCTFIDPTKEMFVGYKSCDKLDYLIEENSITLDDVETYIENFKTTEAYRTKNIKELGINPKNTLTKQGVINHINSYNSTFLYKGPNDDFITELKGRLNYYYRGLTVSKFLTLNGWDSYSWKNKITKEKEKELRDIFEKNKELKVTFEQYGILCLQDGKLIQQSVGPSVFDYTDETFKYLKSYRYYDSVDLVDNENNFLKIYHNNSMSYMKINFNKNEKLPQIN